MRPPDSASVLVRRAGLGATEASPLKRNAISPLFVLLVIKICFRRRDLQQKRKPFTGIMVAVPGLFFYFGQLNF